MIAGHEAFLASDSLLPPDAQRIVEALMRAFLTASGYAFATGGVQGLPEYDEATVFTTGVLPHSLLALLFKVGDGAMFILVADHLGKVRAQQAVADLLAASAADPSRGVILSPALDGPRLLSQEFVSLIRWP